MLVLSRRTGEGIRIGDTIDLKVLRISGSHIRLGIDCPSEIPILRRNFAVRSINEAEHANCEPSPDIISSRYTKENAI